MPREAAVKPNTHVIVMLVCGEKVVAYRTLDIGQSGYRPLVKELSYRAVQAHPELAGAAWQLSVALRQMAGGACLELEAWTDLPQPDRLATLLVPVDNLAWIGFELAQGLGIDRREASRYTIQVAVPKSDEGLIRAEAASGQDDDLALACDDDQALRLPEEFSTEPLGPRRVVRERNTWLHCVFTAGAWAQFLAAAAVETRVERGWGAPVRVHLARGACYLVIPDMLVEFEVAAGPDYMIASGQETFALRKRLGGDLGAFLHLHPQKLGQQILLPCPSSADVGVAWDCCAGSSTPVVLPIALFGARPERYAGQIAAHAFVGGLLTEISLEVLV